MTVYVHMKCLAWCVWCLCAFHL